MMTATAETRHVLRRLLANAGLPPPVGMEALSGRGFESEIFVVTSEDGRRCVLRVRRVGTVVGREWAAFLASLDLPMPRILATDGRAELHEFVAGQTIGDAIEAGVMTDRMWKHVGSVFARIHAVVFPSGLSGLVGPAGIELRMRDPVIEMYDHINTFLPQLEAFGAEVQVAFAGMTREVDRLAAALRRSPVSLLHGDANMWNVLVDEHRAVAIDWDYPAVGLSWREIALLDKHAWLFNGMGLPEAFFAVYGGIDRDVMALHRVLETVKWALGDSDWEEFAKATPDLRDRAATWHRTLRDYVADLPRRARPGQ